MTARQAALAALQRCRRDRAWSSQVIDGIIREQLSDGREAALAARLCLGVLQNSALLDYYIDAFCTVRGAKLEPKLRDILRLGAYQLLFLDKIPVSAAVNESVSLSRSSGFERASGLVNAVLRRLAEQKDDLPELPGAETAEYLSVRYSHPRWLAERLIGQYGYAFTEGFFAANNSPADTALQINTLKSDRQKVAELFQGHGISFETPDWPSNCILTRGGRVSELPGFEQGLFYVQDRAARAAVEIAGPRPGMRVLDACSAPGGKSFAAAVSMENKGKIFACDIHEKKLSLVRGGAQRLGIDIIETGVRDARAPAESLRSSFDLVIADVPCSGLGVIRKKPEIRYKREEELSSLPEIQSAILENLAGFVKPGGVLLYSTCTILREENEAVVCRFLDAHDGFAPEDFSVGQARSSDGMYTFWPHIDGCDGFFAAKLRRIV